MTPAVLRAQLLDWYDENARDLPWRVLHHYGKDRKMLLDEPVNDGALEFLPSKAKSAGPTALAA